jgi:hypothetical protein
MSQQMIMIPTLKARRRMMMGCGVFFTHLNEWIMADVSRVLPPLELRQEEERAARSELHDR